MAQPEGLKERVDELVQHFATPRPGENVASLKRNIKGALEGPFATEIFGDDLPTLCDSVETLSESDHAGVNTTIYKFSRALLLKHQSLLEGGTAA